VFGAATRGVSRHTDADFNRLQIGVQQVEFVEIPVLDDHRQPWQAQNNLVVVEHRLIPGLRVSTGSLSRLAGEIDLEPIDAPHRTSPAVARNYRPGQS
jgi:hypothetical protein